MPKDQPQSPVVKKVSFKNALESIPPGRVVRVHSVATESERLPFEYQLNLPDLQLYCDGDTCSGVRFFGVQKEYPIKLNTHDDYFLDYVCRNCQWTSKTYAIAVVCDESLNGTVFKYGEKPAFGPLTPARVIKLLGPEKDYYLKGRRAESQGMGVGAFAYYRRVVENQKNRLLDEIISVAEKIGASPEMLEELNQAKSETQFSKAVDAMKHGIPSALLVNGHNPLKLLHAALSEGLHAQTDEECLASASSIRIVLADLADRLGHALKERAELDAAVSRLLK